MLHSGCVTGCVLGFWVSGPRHFRNNEPGLQHFVLPLHNHTGKTLPSDFITSTERLNQKVLQRLYNQRIVLFYYCYLSQKFLSDLFLTTQKHGIFTGVCTLFMSTESLCVLLQGKF